MSTGLEFTKNLLLYPNEQYLNIVLPPYLACTFATKCSFTVWSSAHIYVLLHRFSKDFIFQVTSISWCKHFQLDLFTYVEWALLSRKLFDTTEVKNIYIISVTRNKDLPGIRESPEKSYLAVTFQIGIRKHRYWHKTSLSVMQLFTVYFYYSGFFQM